VECLAIVPITAPGDQLKVPSNSKPRKQYKPRPQILSPLGYVLEGLESVKSHESYMRTLKIRNSAAMVALLQGKATKLDMNVLVAMSNMVEVFCSMGFGKEYVDVSTQGRTAVLGIIFRAVEKMRFVPKGEEIKALQDLVELHDQQMDVITVNELDAALTTARKRVGQKDTIKLPEMSDTAGLGVSDER